MPEPGTNHPRVTVIIPTYRRLESVRKAVLSLFDQDLPKNEYEVIVVDSSPEDSVAAMVRDLARTAPFDLRCYVKSPEGPGASRHLGAQNARGDFFAFMDSDCFATPSWLREALAAFEDGIGLVQGRVLPDPEGKPGIFTYYPTVQSESHIYECANVIYRRAAFEDVGGFGQTYKSFGEIAMGGEDVDLAWRVKRKGWRSRFTPNALVYHEVRPITPFMWVFIKPLYIWPQLVKRHPELRQFFFCRYFFDRFQAYLTLGLLGVLLAFWHPASLLLLLPYWWVRSAEPTRSLRGPKRLLRPAIYLVRDVVSFGLLLAGSIRFRALLL